MNESTVQLLTVVLANLSVILWFRKESREDSAKIEKQSREDWLRTEVLIKENQTRTEALIKTIQDEMKDFHERLLKIEMDRIK